MLISFLQKRVSSFTFLVLLFFVLSSCGGHYKHVMFQVDEDNAEMLSKSVQKANESYVLKANDKFSLRVYTNKGELILDPNKQFSKSLDVSLEVVNEEKVIYDVLPNGTAYLPVLGSINVAGYTVSQLDSLLNNLYSNTAYNDAFVVTKVENNRVIVLGGGAANQKQGAVIPLENNNMNLIEVIALAGGMPQYNKSSNIRLIRGDLKNPSVQLIDLSTIEGMMQANLEVQPNDIIYIEPVKRVLPETFKEVSPVLGAVTSLATLIFIVTRPNN